MVVLGKKLRVCIVCATIDESFAVELAKHLKPLEMQGYIKVWNPWLVLPGEDREAAIASQIDQADLIIPLLSIDLVTTPETFELLGRAVDRHHQGGRKVIPVKVRAADYSGAPLEAASLKVLPKDGIPINLRGDRDAAWAEVTRTIRGMINGTMGAFETNIDDNLFKKKSHRLTRCVRWMR